MLNQFFEYICREITDCWNGERSLAYTFVRYKVALGIAFSVLITPIDLKLPDLFPVYFAFFIVYNIWVTFAVWNSAFNTPYPFFGYLARGLVTISCLFTMLLLPSFVESRLKGVSLTHTLESKSSKTTPSTESSAASPPSGVGSS